MVLPALTLVFALVTTNGVEPQLCPKLAKRYETAVAEVNEALRVYEKCVSASRGRDTCSEEFTDLDVAQEGFETAVVAYEKVCR